MSPYFHIGQQRGAIGSEKARISPQNGEITRGLRTENQPVASRTGRDGKDNRKTGGRQWGLQRLSKEKATSLKEEREENMLPSLSQ